MPRKKMSKEDEIQIRLVLTGEMAARFNKIKQRYGLETNADVVRLLITLEYDRLASGRS